MTLPKLPGVVPELIKENPLKSMAATVAAAGVLLTAIFTIDARYAHAVDLQRESLTQQKQITSIEYNSLEDKVFELDLKKANKPREWSATDEVLLQRYKRRAQEVSEIKRAQARAESKFKEND